MARKTSVSTEMTLPPVPMWMVTFSDTMGLLVTFFVMLIGFSAMDEDNRSRAPGMLSGYIGMNSAEDIGNDSLREPKDVAGGTQMSGYETIPDYDPLSYVQQGFETHVKASRVGNILRYRLTEKGLEITIVAGALFQQDQIAFRARAEEILNVITKACKNLPNPIRVQAFPDDLFIPNEQFGRAEELALARSAALCGELRDRGISPMRLSTAVELNDVVSLPLVQTTQVTLTVLRPVVKVMP